MRIKCGIVGLPNVGKSTLFNALTKTMAAEAANYPFCTIDPNIGKVNVPDNRLDKIAKIAASKEIISTQIEFVDIAGLAKGASKGDGLGNQFLSHIREVDAIVYVLRCFDSNDITHVEGSVDPIRDAEIIETELILADIESLQKRLPNMEKKAKRDVDLVADIANIKKILPLLEQGRPAAVALSHGVALNDLKKLSLLTQKPVMYVCNVGENEAINGNKYSENIKTIAKTREVDVVLISAKIESEIANLGNEAEKQEFLEAIGLTETGLSKIIKKAYKLLDLITYFTAGIKETRAWNIRNDTNAAAAAGVIHSDFEQGFIRAETISYNDYIECKGENGAKNNGKQRLEGKDYIVQDGDIMHFRFNV